jgi:hypothetical protein
LAVSRYGLIEPLPSRSKRKLSKSRLSSTWKLLHPKGEILNVATDNDDLGTHRRLLMVTDYRKLHYNGPRLLELSRSVSANLSPLSKKFLRGYSPSCIML